MHFLDIIFQQDNAPVHKSNIIGSFFPRERVKSAGMASIQSRSETCWKFMGNFAATITKTDSFFGKN